RLWGHEHHRRSQHRPDAERRVTSWNAHRAVYVLISATLSRLHVEHGCVGDCRAAADLALDHGATIVRFRASRLASATTATPAGRRARPIPARSFRRTGSSRAQAFDSIKLRRCTNASQRWVPISARLLSGLMQSEQYTSGCGPASLISIRTAPSDL